MMPDKQLEQALIANGIDPRFDMWRDHQKLGQAVHEALERGRP